MSQLDGFLESDAQQHDEPQGEVAAQSVGEVAASPAAQEFEPQAEQPRTAEQQEPTGGAVPAGFAPMKAVLEERRKRQELEQEVARYRASMQQEQPQQQAQPQGQDVPEVMNMVMNMAEQFMRTQHQDYDGARDHFLQQARQNPYLIWQMRQAPNPAQFAYEMGKKLQTLDELGDPNAFREKVRAELMAEIQGTQQVQTQRKAIASASDSLANARAVGAASAPDWSGPSSLDEILASKQRRK